MKGKKKVNSFRKIKGPLILTICALIWGTAFVFQSVGMDYIKPFSFLAARSFVGCIVLIPLIIVSRVKSSVHKPDTEKNWLKGGIICGVVLFAASAFQQIGIQYTTAGEAGFLTALYIVIVPVLGIFMGKKVGMQIWRAVALALIGAYLLSVKDGFSVSQGAWWLLLCSLVFSFHILVCEKYGTAADPIKLSCMQFLVCGILSAVFAFAVEHPTAAAFTGAVIPILYCGIMSSGVAYTLQIVGQRYTQATVASLIMSLESVFSALAGWVILGEILSVREIIGCVLVFSAVVLAQLPSKKKNN